MSTLYKTIQIAYEDNETAQDFTENLKAALTQSDNMQAHKFEIIGIVPQHTDRDTAPWRFVEKYYPKYHNSEEIRISDDLTKLKDKEDLVDEDIAIILKVEYNNDLNNPRILQDYNTIHIEVYETAITAYLEQLNT